MTLPTVTFYGHEVFGFAVRLDASSAAAGSMAYATTRHFGGILQTKVKGNARGRPGPRMQTGDYNRSIELRFTLVDASPVATVGTNEPQGRRLEDGFEDTDSLGRTYHQPPYPHFGPAVDEVEQPYTEAIAAIPERSLR